MRTITTIGLDIAKSVFQVHVVIPVGLLGAQQLVLAEKDLNGRVATKEIMPVLFSLLEGSEQPIFRAS